MLNEVAKPRKAAVQEVLRTADIFEYTAEEGVRVAGTVFNSDSFPGEKRNKLALVSRVPLGVIVAIPPFNYPLNLAGSKVAPALIAGNALVMKPPSQVHKSWLQDAWRHLENNAATNPLIPLGIRDSSLSTKTFPVRCDAAPSPPCAHSLSSRRVP
jgi:acyl-CoA reductase-like NAD-dependent aldehyde dehydrogenase